MWYHESDFRPDEKVYVGKLHVQCTPRMPFVDCTGSKQHNNAPIYLNAFSLEARHIAQDTAHSYSLHTDWASRTQTRLSLIFAWWKLHIAQTGRNESISFFIFYNTLGTDYNSSFSICKSKIQNVYLLILPLLDACAYCIQCALCTHLIWFKYYYLSFHVLHKA